MSKFSGKCDFADSLEINKYTLEELQNNVLIYIGNNPEPLHIEKMSDLIPYYPYLIGMAYHDNKERKAIINLSSESWVDREERYRLETYLKYILRIYNRCKRKKIEMSIDDVVEEICWNDWNKEQVTELANRVKKCGKKATIDGIHLKMHEHYRQELVDLMVENDLEPCRYGGYERFVNKERIYENSKRQL